MQEVFYEESATIINAKSEKNKYNLLKTISIISYVILGVWLFLVFMFYEFSNAVADIIFILIPTALFFATGLLFGKFKNKYCVEYDYTFVSGSIRFSKVIKNRKRKFIVEFDCADVETIGRVGSDTFEKYFDSPNIIKSVLTSNDQAGEGKDFYYIVANTGDGKNLYILECTQTLLANILKFSKRTVLEGDFKR